MHLRHRTAVNRFLQLLGFVVVSAALVAPGAHAQDRKKASAKKSQVSASSSATFKRAVAPRKVAAAAKPVRVSAKTSKAATRVAFVPAKPSFGQMAGLHEINDPLDLKSSVALVIDQDTHEVLLSKNDQAVLPIASLTKLMTGMIISQAKLPMDEPITITQDDVDTEKGSRSRLSVGTTLTRGEMLHLALMSSENRAAHALGRTYPGGLDVFVAQMNAKAKLLGMTGTRYV
ncbi:MAG: peptidase S11, partial [Alcaligenaceae bacterium]